MFTLSGYGVYFSPKLRQKSQPRTVSKYEIELYGSADGTTYVDGKAFPCRQHRILFFRPSQKRQNEGQFQCYFLRFDCDQPGIRKYLDALPTEIPAGDSGPIYQIFRDMFQALAQKQPGYQLLVYAKITELIAKLYHFSQTDLSVDEKYVAYTPAVFEAIHYMQAHFGEHITLDDIAEKVQLSPSFFHVVFKNICHKTPHQYLLELRLTAAKDLLIHSDLALTAIAETCGFDSQVYFNYIIKKELGVTPKKYRDSLRNKNYTL